MTVLASGTGKAAPQPSDPIADPTPGKAATTRGAHAPGDGDVTLAALLDEPPPRAWYRKPVAWIAAALLLLAIAGAWYWQARRTANAQPTYVTQPVGRGDLTLRVTANGTLQPTRTIDIGSELSGTVLTVLVDVNDPVRKGQVLVELDTAKLRDQILRSQAAHAAATARVAMSVATRQEARASLARLEAVARLSGGRVPSRAELDAGRAASARATADVDSARAAVDEAAAALSTDRINLAKASITAPADGIVLTRSVDPGNAVAASLQAVTLFTVAEDLRHLRLWVYVDEADVGAVQVGQRATFTVSAFASRAFPARITRVGFGSTVTDNLVTYLTHLDVDNADRSLRPGMSATATIVATQRTNVLRVPNSALRFHPGTTAKAAAAPGGVMANLGPRMPGRRSRAGASDAGTASAREVWVLRDGVPVAVAVVPGISDGRMTEITAGDLRAGMAVITDQKLAPSA
jgi:HlyD family secretion protein